MARGSWAQLWTENGCKIRPIAEDDLEAILAVYRQCEDFLALGPQPQASPEMVAADMRQSQAEGGAGQ